MDDRIIEFVRGMRAAGVRVSMAESMDAMRAVEVGFKLHLAKPVDAALVVRSVAGVLPVRT